MSACRPTPRSTSVPVREAPCQLPSAPPAYAWWFSSSLITEIRAPVEPGLAVRPVNSR